VLLAQAKEVLEYDAPLAADQFQQLDCRKLLGTVCSRSMNMHCFVAPLTASRSAVAPMAAGGWPWVGSAIYRCG